MAKLTTEEKRGRGQGEQSGFSIRAVDYKVAGMVNVLHSRALIAYECPELETAVRGHLLALVGSVTMVNSLHTA